MQYIRFFSEIRMRDVAAVGGKTASLGEMLNSLSKKNIRVPNGFAIVADAYWYFLNYNKLTEPISQLLEQINEKTDLEVLKKVGAEIRSLIEHGTLPEDLASEIRQAYKQLGEMYNQKKCAVAVRSSATAEDLPGASFAGQQETFLNITGEEELLKTCLSSFASLFTDRSIMYRVEKKFQHMKIALSIGVQKMVRSDKGCSGVLFTLDTESGFKDVVIINGSWGLGETIVKGLVTPDEFWVHKPTFEQGFRSLIKKNRGSKQIKLVYNKKNAKTTVKQIATTGKEREQFCITDDEIFQLTQAGLIIEQHYSQLNDKWMPMDVEWAKDGVDGQLYIVQARPETVHAMEKKSAFALTYKIKLSDAQKEQLCIATGQSIGQSIASGRARVANNIKDIDSFNEGDILIAPMTDPDWVPLMKKAAALVTERGGRTSHAAIVSRELGIPAVVGAFDAMKLIKNGDEITVDCTQGSQGYVYKGIIQFQKQEVDISSLPELPVDVLINIAEPDRAFHLSFLPIDGVGLARTEFIISNRIKMHPMVAVEPNKINNKKIKKAIADLIEGYKDPQSFFVDCLAQGVGSIAAALYPKPVVVRFSDFKSNEYRNLIGGQLFEPQEENPMLGLRGASRYYSSWYEKAFALECRAMKKARDEMGFSNIILMIPFVRTLIEAQKVIDLLKKNGLERKKDNLQLYMMCEIPSNVILINEFSAFFDGFSIGSNDLTQTTLAVDRDSALLAQLFDERDPAVMKMMQMAVEGATKNGKHSGICGQAPSDYPEIGDFLIKIGIDSISLNPDQVIPFLLRYRSKLA